MNATTNEGLEAAFARAAALDAEGRLAEAAEVLRAVTKPVLTVNVAGYLGSLLTRIGQYDEAEHWLGTAARHRPGKPELRLALARLYEGQRRLDLAELEYKTVLVIDPENNAAKLGLAGLFMSQGRYDEGWPLMEARMAANPKLIPPVEVAFPEWKGEPLTGKSILVCYEQGFGDQIQMVRFARDLKARGAAHVAISCRPPLKDLLATADGVDEVIPIAMGENVAIRLYDYWSRYFSVPHRLRATLANLPKPPYLSPPADRREKWRGYSGIGIAWRASPTGFNGRNKTLPDEQARRLLDLGAISLDPADTGVSDFADTAAIIEQLDLVISIDSAVAHLAGAMGKPVWTLLPFLYSDWRWLRDRSDSPWYPSMRLYRQTAPDLWAPLVDQIIADLAARPART